MRINSLLAALAALAALAFGACTSVARQEELDSKEARWKEIEVAAPSDRVVWQLALLTLQTKGYPMGSGTDMVGRTIQSGWKQDLQPFRGEGQRRRAIMRLSPVEAGRWKLEARVQCQHNENLVSPLQAELAEWEPAADDAVEAQVLLQHVRSRLAPEDAAAGQASAAKSAK
jgi:hypothetical protein